MNTQIKKTLAITPAKEIAGRMKALNWERVSQELDSQGCGVIAGLVTPVECGTLAGLLMSHG
jgi:hypothetical protein